MPIRRRLSDPYGAGKEFDRLRREGPLPKTPERKPPSTEREPLLDALRSLPIGQNMSKISWIEHWSQPFISKTFPLWGIDLALYPMARTEYNESKSCTGVMVLGLKRTRRGVQPMLKFNEPYNRVVWYHTILNWIIENYYGG